MPSLRERKLLLLVFATFVFARLTGGRLPYYAFYLSITLLVSCWLWAWYAGNKLTYHLSLPSTHMSPGERQTVRLRLDNDSMLPLPWLEVEDCTPSPRLTVDMPRQATSVPAAGTRLFNFGVTAKRRGHYRLGPVRATTGDAFGVFRVQREFQSSASITVYPTVHRLEGLPIPLSQPFGPVRTRQRAFADPASPADIRPYYSGDNPRHIHWRSSAKRGELMLRQFELQATTQLFVLLDLHEREHWDDSAETAIELAASLASLALERGLEVGLTASGAQRYNVPFGHGRRTFSQVLDVLARVETGESSGMEQMAQQEGARLRPHSGIVVITPALSPALADVLLRLGGAHAVMLVLLKAETYGAPAVPSGRDALASTLVARGHLVYLVGAGDDLRRLHALRLDTKQPSARRIR